VACSFAVWPVAVGRACAQACVATLGAVILLVIGARAQARLKGARKLRRPFFGVMIER